ncbi:uncharacterized protein EDB91DRAFT_1079495 [Suillus paluster]|uniref:uncharacterized protein n=1 Tax=Suillus paluster TaxID=48578 RepID=UPI001B87484B|nr:uncharacterized protein EDB91DRAFT_1079495 [Suillus paluster]KAG1747773.1 hypothetical protein EDB91DRAFT_1079495 [Suillus paluster]
MQDDTVNQQPASRRRLQAHHALIKSGSGQAESSRVGRRKRARPQVESAPYPGPDAAQDQLDVDHHDYEFGDSDHHEPQSAGHPLNVPPSDEPNVPPPDKPNVPPPDKPNVPPPDEPNMPPPDEPNVPPPNEPNIPPSDEPNVPPPNEPNVPPPDKPNMPPPDEPQHLPRPLHHVFDIDQLEEEAVLPKQTDAVAFIKLLRVASLDDPVAKLDDAALNRLRNPYQTGLEIDSSAVRHGIATYFALEHSAINAYESIRQSAARCLEGEATQIPSYYNVERLIAEYTGVESIEHDMCPDTCVAFTGPFADLTHCPICNTDRYDPIKLHMSGGRMHIALAQLQALWRDRDQAQAMGYLREGTQRLFETLRVNGGIVDVFDDFCKGREFLQAVQRGDIKPDDIVLMISLDGAQLYESKLSDCWIYIWVIMNHAPDQRYKKQYVLPGGFIPGPNKPKNVDSFLFPDGPGLVYFDGMVGHSGKNGCRLYCGLLGRRKGTHYYPALLIPHRYAVAGSNHPDVSVYELHDPDLTEYFDNLLKLVAAPNTRQYRKLRTQTGITKPSLLLGLHPSYTLGIPNCLTPDIMHLAQLLSDLLLSLWRGTMDHTLPDHVSMWPWAIFHDAETWETHGEAVSNTAQHLPGSFD